MRWLLFVCFAGLVSGCASQVPEPNLGLYKDRLVAWHDSGAYDRCFAKTAARGLAILRREISARRPGEPRAVVFDIDETCLSNWPYLKDRNFGITEDSFANWADARDDAALKPVRQIYQEARLAGISIFLITGRSETLRGDTIRQLEAAGYSGWEQLFLKPSGYNQQSIVPFKSGVRQSLRSRGFRIVLNIGDQWSDLEGGFAENSIKLPNPYYYIR